MIRNSGPVEIIITVVMAFIVVFGFVAIASAAPSTKMYCSETTGNGFDKTTCILKNTL
jgi:hypothetical protein